jgi:hypothetical protein
MNNEHESTYTLLVRSEEKGRDVLETAVYLMCILSAVIAIWQFVAQSSQLSVGGLASRTHPAVHISQHAMEPHPGCGILKKTTQQHA